MPAAAGTKKRPRARARAGRYGDTCGIFDGAQEGTRTPTVLLPPGPEPGASTNSATWATATDNFTFRTLRCQRNPPPLRSPAPRKRERRARVPGPSQGRIPECAARRYSREFAARQEPAPGTDPDGRHRFPAACHAPRRRPPRRNRRPQVSPSRRHRSRAAAFARGDPRRAEGSGRAAAAGRPRARDDRRQARPRRVLRPHRRDAARRAAADEPQGRALRHRQARSRQRDRAGTSRRLRLPRPGRRRRRPVPQPRRRCTRCSTATARRRDGPASIGAAGPRGRSSMC